MDAVSVLFAPSVSTIPTAWSVAFASLVPLLPSVLACPLLSDISGSYTRLASSLPGGRPKMTSDGEAFFFFCGDDVEGSEFGESIPVTGLSSEYAEEALFAPWGASVLTPTASPFSRSVDAISLLQRLPRVILSRQMIHSDVTRPDSFELDHRLHAALFFVLLLPPPLLLLPPPLPASSVAPLPIVSMRGQAAVRCRLVVLSRCAFLRQMNDAGVMQHTGDSQIRDAAGYCCKVVAHGDLIGYAPPSYGLCR